MELSCVVYLCYSNGLSHTCLSLLSSEKTKTVGIGLEDSCLLLMTISIGIPWPTMRWKSLKSMEFSNVPLIGTKRGINYNPFLERRQLGYANSSKPLGFTVENYFYHEGEDSQESQNDKSLAS